MNKITLPNELRKFVDKKYSNLTYTVERYDLRGKDHMLWLDFGDDEKVTLIVRQREGDNGNYRATLEGIY